MGVVHMKLGQNIGAILLEIAQTAIQDGDPQKAIDTYTRSLNGFTEEYVIKLLKNEYVLVTDADGVSVKMTDWENERKFNRENITDWNFWLKGKLDEMKATTASMAILSFPLSMSISRRMSQRLSQWGIVFRQSWSVMQSISTMLGSHPKAATSNIELPRYTTKRFLNMINYNFNAL